MACPACSSLKNTNRKDLGVQIFECRKCGCIHGTCYLGDSYSIVKPYLTADVSADTRQVAFDLMTLGSKGMARRHGWFDPATRLMTQVG